MKDDINYEAPSDWGVSSKETWVSFEELKDNGAPVLEGRDVVSFAAVELKPGKPEGAEEWLDVDNRRVKLNKATSSWYHDDPTGQKDLQSKLRSEGKNPPKQNTDSKPEPSPRPQAKPEQKEPVTPKAPEPKRETETQREATEKAKKDIVEGTSVETYRQSEVFKEQTIKTNERFLKNPPHQIIKGKEFVDVRKRLEATGLFEDGVNFPPKYLDLISQLGITKAKGVDGPPLSSYIQGAGAGAPMSQVGELLMLTSSAMSDEQADAFFDILKEIGDSSSVVNKDWVVAAKRNRDALQRAMTNNLGGGQVIAASWDVPEEVRALGLNYEDKGFSTDAFFRVRLDDGSEAIFEVSLKKDKNVFFINGGAASLAEESIKAMPSESPIRRQYEALNSSMQELKDKYTKGANFTAKNPPIPSSKRAPEEKIKDIKDARARYAELEQKKQDLLRENTSPYNTDVYMDKLVSNVYQPAAKEILNDKQALNELERIANEGKVDLDKYIKKLKAGSIEEALKIIAETPPENSTVNHKKLLAKVLEATKKVSSDNNTINQYAKALNDEYQKFRGGLSRELAKEGPLQTAVVSNIRKEFPLKAVLSGEEVMCIGDANFDLKTAERIFGTTDINEINQKLTIKKDEKGNPILVYSAGEEGEEIPVAIIGARQKGIGYEAMGFEAALHPQFYDKLVSAVQQENLGGVKRVRYTKAESKKGDRNPARHIPEGRSFMEDKKLSVEDYLEVIKLSRSPEYSDSMVYYRGKALGRCPAGTTKVGKTCAPVQKEEAGRKYNKNVLGGLSRQQVARLSKAKSTEQIIEAHKEKTKKKTDD
jgi:hypothetical protein